MRRIRRWTLSPIVFSVLVAGTCYVGWAWRQRSLLCNDDWIEEVERARCESMYHNALSYWAENGVFPLSKRDLGPQALEEGAPRWIFESAHNRFTLVLGDYDRCGWVMSREFAWWYEPRTSPPVDLGGEGLELLRLLMNYYLQHGEWPTNIEQLGLAPDWGECGPWSLEPPTVPTPYTSGQRGAVVRNRADSPFAVIFYWMPHWE
jgi:hypothetical protein